MTTRYSLPPAGQQTETARGARIIAALVLVLTVITLSLLIVLLPASEPGMAAAPESEGAPAPVVVGA
jgi:hypothetical protein